MVQEASTVFQLHLNAMGSKSVPLDQWIRIRTKQSRVMMKVGKHVHGEREHQELDQA